MFSNIFVISSGILPRPTQILEKCVVWDTNPTLSWNNNKVHVLFLESYSGQTCSISIESFATKFDPGQWFPIKIIDSIESMSSSTGFLTKSLTSLRPAPSGRIFKEICDLLKSPPVELAILSSSRFESQSQTGEGVPSSKICVTGKLATQTGGRRVLIH